MEAETSMGGGSPGQEVEAEKGIEGQMGTWEDRKGKEERP